MTKGVWYEPAGTTALRTRKHLSPGAARSKSDDVTDMSPSDGVHGWQLEDFRVEEVAI